MPTAVDRFQTSLHAFEFTNSWPSQSAIVKPTPFGNLELGNANAGLCGGMVFAALDYWYAGLPLPTARPAQGDPLFSHIVRRLIDSWHLPGGVIQYYQWMNLPDGDRGFDAFGRRVITERGLAWRTIKVQWPQIAADLDAHVPVPLGLVTIASGKPSDLSANHQVLATGYERDGDLLTVRVYDPNRGPREDIFIRVDVSRPTKPTAFAHNVAIKRSIRGFFRTAYSPSTPPS
jgi:hypothetical protein